MLAFSLKSGAAVAGVVVAVLVRWGLWTFCGLVLFGRSLSLLLVTVSLPKCFCFFPHDENLLSEFRVPSSSCSRTRPTLHPSNALSQVLNNTFLQIDLTSPRGENRISEKLAESARATRLFRAGAMG